jgi:hypothetical protein
MAAISDCTRSHAGSGRDRHIVAGVAASATRYMRDFPQSARAASPIFTAAMAAS